MAAEREFGHQPFAGESDFGQGDYIVDFSESNRYAEPGGGGAPAARPHEQGRVVLSVAEIPVQPSYHPRHFVFIGKGQVVVLGGFDPDQATDGLDEVAAHKMAVGGEKNLLCREVFRYQNGALFAPGLQGPTLQQIDFRHQVMVEVDRKLDIHRVVIGRLQGFQHPLH